MRVDVPLLPQLEANLFLLLQACSDSPFHPEGVASPENPSPSLSSNIPTSHERIVPLAIESIENLNTDILALKASTETFVQTETTLRELQRILQNITDITTAFPSNHDAQSMRTTTEKCSKTIQEKITSLKAPAAEEPSSEPQPHSEPPKEGFRIFSMLRSAGTATARGLGAALQVTGRAAVNVVKEGARLLLSKRLPPCKQESNRQLLRIQKTIFDPETITDSILRALPEEKKQPELKEALKRALSGRSPLLSERSCALYTEELLRDIDSTHIVAHILSTPSETDIKNIFEKLLGQGFGDLCPEIREIVLKDLLHSASHEIVPVQRETLAQLLQEHIENVLQQDDNDCTAVIIQRIVQDERIQPFLSRFEINEENLTINLKNFFKTTFVTNYQNQPEKNITHLIDSTMLGKFLNPPPSQKIQECLKRSIEKSFQSLSQNLLETVIDETPKNAPIILKEQLIKTLKATLRKYNDRVEETLETKATASKEELKKTLTGILQKYKDTLQETLKSKPTISKDELAKILKDVLQKYSKTVEETVKTNPPISTEELAKTLDGILQKHINTPEETLTKQPTLKIALADSSTNILQEYSNAVEKAVEKTFETKLTISKNELKNTLNSILQKHSNSAEETLKNKPAISKEELAKNLKDILQEHNDTVEGTLKTTPATSKEELTKSSRSLLQEYDKTVEKILKTEITVPKEELTRTLQSVLQECDKTTETRLFFADNLSNLIIIFLEEQLVHVDQREPALRAQFISKFFIDPSAKTPTRTNFGNIAISLIEENKEFAKELVRANVLRAVANGYQALESYQKDHPYLLVDYIHKAFEIGTEEIQHEERVQKEGGTHLSPEARKRILDKSLQREMAAFLLTICFPHGSDDLFVPVGIEMGQSMMWEPLRQVIEDLASDFFKDTIESQDIKQSLLRMGLEKVTEVLSGQSVQPPTTQEGAPPDKTQPHRGGIIAVGMIAAFIKIIFDAIWEAFRGRKRTRGPSNYPRQDSFNARLYTTYQALEKELFIGKFIPQRLSRKIVHDYIGPNLVCAINEIRIPDLVDEQLKAISEKIKPDSANVLFPKTWEEKEEIEKEKEAQRKEDQENIENLESHIGDNIEGLINATYALWEIDTTGLDATDVHKARQAFNRIKLFAINFANACIYKCIRFFLWLFRTRSFVHNLGEQALKKTDLIKQDIIVAKVATDVLSDAERRPIRTESPKTWSVKEKSCHLHLFPQPSP